MSCVKQMNDVVRIFKILCLSISVTGCAAEQSNFERFAGICAMLFGFPAPHEMCHLIFDEICTRAMAWLSKLHISREWIVS